MVGFIALRNRDGFGGKSYSTMLLVFVSSDTSCTRSMHSETDLIAVSPAIYEGVGGVKRKNDLPPVRDVEGSQGRPEGVHLDPDGPLRPPESRWERSETKFSEASFLRGHSLFL